MRAGGNKQVAKERQKRGDSRGRLKRSPRYLLNSEAMQLVDRQTDI